MRCAKVRGQGGLGVWWRGGCAGSKGGVGFAVWDGGEGLVVKGRGLVVGFEGRGAWWVGGGSVGGSVYIEAIEYQLDTSKNYRDGLVECTAPSTA